MRAKRSADRHHTRSMNPASARQGVETGAVQARAGEAVIIRHQFVSFLSHALAQQCELPDGAARFRTSVETRA